MSEKELREKTSCSEINTEQGNLINSSTNWNLTASLVTRVDVPIEDLKCQKRTERINAFLPIPELTREEAEDLCHKFGEDVHIAGQFNSEEDFDHYYDGKMSFRHMNFACQFIYIGIQIVHYASMYFYFIHVLMAGLQRNKMYVEECGYYDNDRLLTWLPYKRNKDSSALVHDLSQQTLLGDQVDKYYTYWYSGPQVSQLSFISQKVPEQSDNHQKCVHAYFGLVEKYQNIMENSCFYKMCTACEIKNSLQETSKLTLRGLCRYSSFDTTYTVRYSPDSTVFYVGVERTVISYNFTLNIWTMRDITNPSVTAVSQASFRSLAIGNIKWTISNDTKCNQGLDRN